MCHNGIKQLPEDIEINDWKKYELQNRYEDFLEVLKSVTKDRIFRKVLIK